MVFLSFKFQRDIQKGRGDIGA